jgi:hypothetical protein
MSVERGGVAILTKDLLFAVSIRNTVRSLGFDPRIIKSTDALSDALMVDTPALVVADLGAIGATGDWEVVSEAVAQGAPVLVFGPHKDVDGLRAAKAAGVTRVVSNGQFHREMAALIERYASCDATDPRSEPDSADEDEDEELSSMPPGIGVFSLNFNAAPEAHF